MDRRSRWIGVRCLTLRQKMFTLWFFSRASLVIEINSRKEVKE